MEYVQVKQELEWASDDEDEHLLGHDIAKGFKIHLEEITKEEIETASETEEIPDAKDNVHSFQVHLEDIKNEEFETASGEELPLTHDNAEDFEMNYEEITKEEFEMPSEDDENLGQFGEDNPENFQVQLEQIPKNEIKQELIISSESDEQDLGALKEGGSARKRKFQRIKPINDDSSSDSSEIVVLKKKKRSRIIKAESKSHSGRNYQEEEYSDQDDQSSQSSRQSDSSPKARIEFESSSDDDDEDAKSDKSYTSSEPDENNFYEREEKECVVCRNLGDINVTGRARRRSWRWCKCGQCRKLGYMKDYDCICCREIQDIVEFLNEEMDDATKKQLCITAHPRFQVDVLKKKALERTRYSRTYNYNNSPTFERAWSFIRWIWDRLGYDTRMMVPACAAAHIKEYVGTDSFHCFTAVKTCRKHHHCAKSQLQ